MKKSMNRLQTSKIFRMLSETNGMMSTSDSQNQKSHVAVKKAFISNGKTELMTYSAHFLLISYLMIWPIVTFCCSLRMSKCNVNDEPFA